MIFNHAYPKQKLHFSASSPVGLLVYQVRFTNLIKGETSRVWCERSAVDPCWCLVLRTLCPTTCSRAFLGMCVNHPRFGIQLYKGFAVKAADFEVVQI